MSRIMRIIILAVIVASLAGPASATNYYMATTGSDAAAGTIGAPWAHMQRADSILVAGDTLFVRGGTYSDRQFLDTWNAHDGTDGHPIVVIAYPGEVPYFNGDGTNLARSTLYDGEGNVIAQAATGRFNFYRNYWEMNGINALRGSYICCYGYSVASVYGCNHVTIKNCSFKGTPSARWNISTTLDATLYVVSASYLTVDACSIQYGGRGDESDGYAVMLKANCHHVIIENSVLRFGDHGVMALFSWTGSGWDNGCPHLCIVRNNIIDQLGTDAFDGSGWGGNYGIDHIYQRCASCDSTPTYNLYEGNSIRGGNSDSRACGMNYGGGVGTSIRKNIWWNDWYSGPGFDAFSGVRYMHRNFFYNNDVIHSGLRALQIHGANGSANPPLEVSNVDNTFANNIFWDAGLRPDPGWLGESHLIEIAATGPGTVPDWWTDDQGMGRNRFLNNLFGNANPAISGALFVVWRNGYQNYYNSDVTTRYPKAFSNNLFSVNPRLSDSTFTHMGLGQNSPCIDKGLRMTLLDTVVTHIMSVWPEAGVDTLHWTGAAPDIGAEERTIPDSLYIAKPDAHALDWGTFHIGTELVAKTVRLLNHTAGTLTGTVSVDKNWFYLNDTEMSLPYSIAPGAAFEFTVKFNPRSRGIAYMATIAATDPFPTITCIGTAVGGYAPMPSGLSVLPFTLSAGGVPGTGELAKKFLPGGFGAQGLTLTPGGSNYDWGCNRPHITSVTITPDTTAGFIVWHTDTASTGWIEWNGGWPCTSPRGNGTTHTDTITGMPEGTLSTGLKVHNANALDPTCQCDSAVSFTTICSALSSPSSCIVSANAGDGFTVGWHTRTGTDTHIRYEVSGGSWTTPTPITEYVQDHSYTVSTALTASSLYLVQMDDYDICAGHKGWSASYSFVTGADGKPGTCPTVAKSAISTGSITASGANLILTTSLASSIRYRYHTSPSGAWSYRLADASNTSHSEAISGLSSNTPYVWETKPIHSQCSDTTAVSYGDSTAFTTLCQTITKSAITTNVITASAAHLKLTLSVAAKVRWRYHTSPSGAWAYRLQEASDSTGRYEPISGLAGNTLYTWQSKIISGTCDTTTWAYGDSTSFTTLSSCPTVAISSLGTKVITATGAKAQFTTDYAVKGIVDLRLYAGTGHVVKYDLDADSLGSHTIDLGTLTANHTHYKYVPRTKYTGCDTSAAGTQQDFYTACNTITISGTGVCYSSGDLANNFMGSCTRSCHVYLHYKINGGSYGSDVDCGTGTSFSVLVAKSNFTAGTWVWETKYVDECGNTSGWITVSNFTILSGGACDSNCGD